MSIGSVGRFLLAAGVVVRAGCGDNPGEQSSALRVRASGTSRSRRVVKSDRAVFTLRKPIGPAREGSDARLPWLRGARKALHDDKSAARFSSLRGGKQHPLPPFLRRNIVAQV
jgi:hypothetical protein